MKHVPAVLVSWLVVGSLAWLATPAAANCLQSWVEGAPVVLSGVVQAQTFLGVAEADLPHPEDGAIRYYNPSGEFAANVGGQAKRVMAVRTERAHSERASVFFFASGPGETWTRIAAVPAIPDLQDPFYFELGGELYLGGVRLVWDEAGTKITSYYTEFFRAEGRDPSRLTSVLRGPKGMKDIRLHEMSGGRILVLTRPQSADPATGGRGQVGMLIATSLGAIKPEDIAAAPLVQSLWPNELYWGGANKILHVDENGMALVLGHVAYFGAKQEGAKETDRNYYPVLFQIDTNTGKMVPFRTSPDHSSALLILTRRRFFSVDFAAKRPDLENVIFSGDLVVAADGTVTFTAGIGDAGVAVMRAAFDRETVALNPLLAAYLLHAA